jgi:two-component system, OmpR family, sensor histidine kinase VicK
MFHLWLFRRTRIFAESLGAFPEGMGSDSRRIPAEVASIRILSDADRIRQQYIALIRSATSEILLVFPTINSIHRESSIGVLEELKGAVKHNVKVRVLCAEDDFIKSHLDELRACGVVIRRIETPTETKFKMLIVDRRASLVVETKDDSKSKFSEAVGLATFSNSNATVLPYVTIFESFWRETELYERAREADRVKDEFVNIAAHELRTPIMPIISGAELIRETLTSVRDKLEPAVFDGLIRDSNLIIRSASKLQKLSEDILQVSRLEAGTFRLNMRMVDVDDLVASAIADIEKKYLGEKTDVKIVYAPLHRGGPMSGAKNGGYSQKLEIYCDSQKISQVLINILDNAMKFTRQGEIRVTSAVDPTGSEVLISVRDSGTGIDPSIKPKLFEKFSTNSIGGTGLGLYLSKRIIDAHNGRIWATENSGDRGSTFTFALPVSDYQGLEDLGNLPVERPAKVEHLR